ncbi:CoA transferase [Pokkaliibacter plantistimulans]|uniref:CoA transferase n=1 Tax=Proteobacteria bacterium 228 TaxID=2083153 RepID=A0A2S5KHY6_9PROT|nr:CaiB/BaiF CoA-transferase family protein [Pokkaliibacter plantistimulans]PPC74213.1 CoA transferase [Pokkaliibacter plantistimulans]
MGVLKGMKVVEIMSHVGPGKFCSMMLAEMGAEVTIVERPAPGQGQPRPYAVFNRGKRSIILDLKKPGSIEAVLALVDEADVVLEGMRPGVMERLGLGPEVCLARRPSLVYGRLTGWGQTGPLAQTAGYDSNFIALSGALNLASCEGTRPEAPPGLYGDVCGGALYLMLGVLSALLRARHDGTGQVVDAAMFDGSANMLNWELAKVAAKKVGLSTADRQNATILQRSCRCADGKWLRIEIDPAEAANLIRTFTSEPALPSIEQLQDTTYLVECLDSLFATKSRDQWMEVLAPITSAVVPILDPLEASRYPHCVARGVFETIDDVLQVSPVPVFSRTPSAQGLRVPTAGSHHLSNVRKIN